MVASSTLLVWSLAALLLFWAIGAYNRLVRLRAQAIAAFATLEQTMVGLPLLIEANFSRPVAEASSLNLERLALMDAGKRFADALRLARVDFNRRVQLYNDAIGQFPALLVASAAGLKSGRTFS